MNRSLRSLCHDAPTCWNQHRNRWPKVIEASSRDLSWSELYKSSEQRTQVPFALYAIINLKNCIRQPEKPQCQKPLVQVMHSYSWIMELDFMNLLLHKWMHISNLVWIMVTHQAHSELNQAKSMRRKARLLLLRRLCSVGLWNIVNMLFVLSVTWNKRALKPNKKRHLRCEATSKRLCYNKTAVLKDKLFVRIRVLLSRTDFIDAPGCTLCWSRRTFIFSPSAYYKNLWPLQGTCTC